jgi:hypothetical protein
MRARSTVLWGLVFARTQASNVARCSFVICNLSAGFHMKPTVAHIWHIVNILL